MSKIHGERRKQRGSLHTIDNEDTDWRHDLWILRALRRRGFGISSSQPSGIAASSVGDYRTTSTRGHRRSQALLRCPLLCVHLLGRVSPLRVRVVVSTGLPVDGIRKFGKGWGQLRPGTPSRSVIRMSTPFFRHPTRRHNELTSVPFHRRCLGGCLGGDHT